VNYSIQHIASVISAKTQLAADTTIGYLLTDTRQVAFPEASLFFALNGPRRSGHQFIAEAIKKGVRNFVVQQGTSLPVVDDCNFLMVPDVLAALQELAAHHRRRFTIPVIGITGSNGKTIVKEWLYQLLQPDYHICRSPRSYNSQTGVPLSVWQLNESHTLGIFEAGISAVGEMERLEKIIQPTMGVVTSLGTAHAEGFSGQPQKAAEKWQLVKHAKQVVYSSDQRAWGELAIRDKEKKYADWGEHATAFLRILEKQQDGADTNIDTEIQGIRVPFRVPFTDAASVSNACTCICVLLLLGYEPAAIQQRIGDLQTLAMRLEWKKAIHHSYLLNDSYSNDVDSLGIALDHLRQQAAANKMVAILSDIYQSGLDETELYRQVAGALHARGIHLLIGIGPDITRHAAQFRDAVPQTAFYPSTEIFLQQHSPEILHDSYILLKGARVFGFERISQGLEEKVHQTVLEINLSAIAHNLREYQKKLQPATRIMAMVKALGYGSGATEVARMLQFHRVDYLAVAYADEGVVLRAAGISLPIMVMNMEESGFDTMLEHQLEPEIHSLNGFRGWQKYLLRQGVRHYPVHIKLNTGMNRLGFDAADIPLLCQWLQEDNTMLVRSVFSHLAASESADLDGFTREQAERFEKMGVALQQALGYSFIRHISNSAAVFRHQRLQYDMIRIGIGLYGINVANDSEVALEPAAALRCTIAQLRDVAAGESVGYNRAAVLERNSRIATIRIGYADGFPRRLGNGIGKVWLRGQLAPVVGQVCMDMTMVDVTGIAGVEEGDVVEIFGPHLPVEQVAGWAGTIVYEIMTGIGQRVKRVYVEE